MLPGYLCRFMDIVMDKLSLHVLPNARSQGKVTFHTLVYDKQTGDFFSLPGLPDMAGRYMYARLPLRVDGTDFTFLPSLAIDNRAAACFNGKQLREKLPDLTLSKQWKDEEIVLVLLE